jgi:putative addiction module killer protein
VNYTSQIFTIRQTETFAEWLRGLRDTRARERIAQRLVRLQSGLFGDVKSVGRGLSELRVDHGPGYRVYFIKRGNDLIVLLCGGDKSTQSRDINAAKVLAAELEN